MIERMFRRTLGSLIAVLVAAHAACGAAPAAAQAYPTRPVTVVVPFAAGGGNDIMARLIAQHLGRALGQQFIIENRAGAGGTVGARAVAKAAPDGYTLMVGHSGVFGVAPALYADPGYEPRRDFAPIGLIASYQQVLVVHPSVPVHSVADLIARARKDPGKITYATAGVGSGSHLSTELFAVMADIKLTHIPYRGTGAMQGDLAGGHVDMSITTFPSVFGQLRSGGLRPIAVTGETRSPIYPDLPTIAEAGVPGYQATNWWGILAPAGTPKEIVDKVHAALTAAQDSPETQKRLESEGADIVRMRPEEFGAFMVSEMDKWGKVVKESGIKAQ